MPEEISDISRQRIAALYPGLRPLVFRVLQDAFNIFKQAMNVAQGMRSMGEQQALYAQGRESFNGSWVITDVARIVTNARPGLSYHSYGLAFDCAFAGGDPYLAKLSEGDQTAHWQKYGEIVTAHGLYWGGNFRLKNGAKDLPHAELAYGLQIHECLELYTQGGIKGLWAYIDKIRGVEVGTDWKL